MSPTHPHAIGHMMSLAGLSRGGNHQSRATMKWKSTWRVSLASPPCDLVLCVTQLDALRPQRSRPLLPLVVCRWRGSPESVGLRPPPRAVLAHCKFQSTRLSRGGALDLCPVAHADPGSRKRGLRFQEKLGGSQRPHSEPRPSLAYSCSIASAMLRPGEIAASHRRHLIFPSNRGDVFHLFFGDRCWAQISENAGHTASRPSRRPHCDQADPRSFRS